MSKEAGVDVLDVSRGNISSAAVKYEVPPIDVPKNFNVPNAARIKKETGMLTVAVGRINDPQQADDILSSGQADMVVIGRGQLADADFCNKALEGRASSIVKCVGCNQGCFDGYVSPDVPFITCLRNPALGREAEYLLVQAEESKKVLIAGGGVGGLEAALTLKRRGHHPILCEATDSLGGQFALAGEAPRKGEMKDAALAMGEMAMTEGIDIRLSALVTPELLDEIKPDLVIIAIEAEPFELNIPGVKLPHVTNSHDVLDGLVAPKGNVVVVGGGLVGLEVAEYLAEQGSQITVVEMQDGVAKDLGQLRKICVMESMYAHKINTILNAKCTEIKDGAIILDVEGVSKEVPCDGIVMAIGVKSRSAEEIITYCNQHNIPHYTIGDALHPRRALDATAEAAKVARVI